jgi:DNA-binding NarL/FixJ family response regulator
LALKVIILDHQPLFRRGLAELSRELAPRAEIKDFGVREDLEAIGDKAVTNLLIVALDDAQTAPIELRELRKDFPKAAIVAIASHCSRSEAERLIQGGVKGIVLRSDQPQRIRSALQLVLDGGVFLPATAGEEADHDVAYGEPEAAPRAKVAEPSLRALLTPRQRSVLALMGRGLSNKRIAQELRVSEGTVKVHVNAILRALQVKNRTQAALEANRVGLGRLEQIRAEHSRQP